MKHKNMKIEINDEQPLDNVVMELELLGFKPLCSVSFNAKIVCTYSIDNTYRTFKNEVCGSKHESTTLQQLREMK